ECRIPTIDGFAGQFGETLRCALAGVPAVRVDADLVATRATDEAIDRDTEQLSLDVVQRLVDAAHDDPADVAAAQEVALVHAEPDLLGVERIGTDQMAFAHVASEGAGLGAAKRVSDLADSDQPLVGGDTHVAEVAPGRAEAECLDRADAQIGRAHV